MPFLRGIHTNAKNEWLRQVNARMNVFIHQPLSMDIRRELENIAHGIHGIGEISINEMLADILEKQAKVSRGF